MQFNNVTKLKVYSTSMVSNVYAQELTCTYDVISTFEVSNSKGKTVTYLGKDVFFNDGWRPMDTVLGEAHDL